MSVNKDALEGMAAVLRENGYKVTLKESDDECTTKKPYISNRFNKISSLDLDDLSYNTCMFLKGGVVVDFEMHDYIAGSCNVTIGYLERVYDEEDADFKEENIIKTNRRDLDGNPIRENLSAYDYVIKLSDVLQLMATNEDFSI